MQCVGCTSSYCICSSRSFETEQRSLWVKWLLADVLVFEILQNDGLLCAHTLSLFLPCLLFVAFYVIHINTLHMHTLFCVRTHTRTHKTHLHYLSLMCQRLLIMRFLPDGKLQGHWLTADFKHCSLPLPFLSSETQRMKGEWEGEQKHTVSHTDSYTHTHTHISKNSEKYVGPCDFAGKHQGEQVLGFL